MSVLSACWDWLAAGLSGRVHEAPQPWIYWHARLMVAAWSFLLPLGALVARFFKVTRRQDWPRELDNAFWWRSHVRLQTAGVLVMTVGLLMAWDRGTSIGTLADLHHLIGWSLAVIGWGQIAGGLLRGSKGGPTGLSMRGDHYDMTRRRVLFEVVHKHLGWASMPAVIVTTALGLVMVDAPRWMALVLAGWWAAMIAAFWVLQRSGRCFDTYQAIWGNSPALPGNRRNQIGWGMARRPAPAEDEPVIWPTTTSKEASRDHRGPAETIERARSHRLPPAHREPEEPDQPGGRRQHLGVL